MMNRNFVGSSSTSRPVNRRDFVVAGALGGLGLTLTDFLSRSAGAEAAPGSSAQSCILLWLNGGLSHHDTLDPKPDALPEIRGEFSPIATGVAGVRFAESVPLLARQMQRLAVFRSVTHPNAAHEAGQAHMLSGYNFGPGHNYPSIGAVVGHEKGPRGGLPAYIVIPGESSLYLHAGHLGSAYNAFAVGSNPNAADFQVRDVEEPADLGPLRSERRRLLRHQLDEAFRAVDTAGILQGMDQFTARAYNLIRSPQARAALDLQRVDVRTRERYGRTTLGQGCLLARRLVEAGVPFVTVSSDGWDHHQNIYPGLASSEMLPALDRGLSVLVDDLHGRGMLERTLVLVLTEFGRTPRINGIRGRDHWSRAFSVVFAGGGVRGGQVIGASDAEGAFPANRPVTPEDLAHTIYTLLNIDPEKDLPSASGRRIQIARNGQFIRELTG